MNITIIFIAHDIEAVGMVAHNIMVMRNGNVIEYNSTSKIINEPSHNYTKKLLDAIPVNPWVK